MFRVTQQLFRPCEDGKGKLFIRSTSHLFDGSEWGDSRRWYFGEVVTDNGLTEIRERQTDEGLVVRSIIEKAYRRPQEVQAQAA